MTCWLHWIRIVLSVCDAPSQIEALSSSSLSIAQHSASVAVGIDISLSSRKDQDQTRPQHTARRHSSKVHGGGRGRPFCCRARSLPAHKSVGHTVEQVEDGYSSTPDPSRHHCLSTDSSRLLTTHLATSPAVPRPDCMCSPGSRLVVPGVSQERTRTTSAQDTLDSRRLDNFRRS